MSKRLRVLFIAVVILTLVLVVTPGYSIQLESNGLVYRYWAANGRVVYVGSFVEPSGRLPNVRGPSVK